MILAVLMVLLGSLVAAAKSSEETNDTRTLSAWDLDQGPSCDDPDVHGTLPFCLNADYEKHMRPNPQKQMTVKLYVVVNDVEEIDDKERSMTIHMRITLTWRDERVKITRSFDDDNSTMVNSSADQVRTVDQEMKAFLWIPDLSIINLKKLQTTEVIRKQATLQIYRNSTISYSFTCRATVGCSFYYEDYPLDEQECAFLLGSFGHSQEVVVYKGNFHHAPARQRILPFEIELFELDKDERSFTETDEDDNKGETYSVTGFKLRAKRYIASYLFRTYFPAAYIVTVSWVSFMIDEKEVPGRLAFLVTLALIEINIITAISASNPPSASATAIEIYGITCLSMVAFALLEYAFVVYKKSPLEMKRRERMPWYKIKKMRKKQKKDKNPQEAQETQEEINKLQAEERKQESKRNRASKCWKFVKKYFDTNYIDICSLCLFPTAFIIFNIVYWTTYLA